MYRSPLLDSACPVCKRGKNVYDYDYVLRPAETLAFTNDTFYKRLQLRFDYGWTNRKSRTLKVGRFSLLDRAVARCLASTRLTSYVPLGSVIDSAPHLPLGLDFHL